MSKEIKVLNERLWNGSQSAYFEGLYKIGERTLKAKVRRDSYDKQSSAVIKVYDPKENKWNFLDEIPYPQMSTVINEMPYVAGATKLKNYLKVDAEKLLERAKLIF